MAERFLYTEYVGGSIPSVPTKRGYSSMDRALPSAGRSGVGSILTSLTNAGVAHLEERVPPKNQAAGSTPVTRTNSKGL